MNNSRIRILAGALLMGLGTWTGARTRAVPGAEIPSPLTPNPTPPKKRPATVAKQSWWDRWLAYRRAWSPPGGGAQERARRRAQIEKGMLGGCNDVRWSDATQAEIDATRARAAARIGKSEYQEAAQAFGREGAFDFGNGVTIGVDLAPGTDVTTYAAVRLRDDGSMEVLDAGELQPAGRDL